MSGALPTYLEYEAIREAARERVQLEWRTPKLLLTAISHQAHTIARSWRMPPRVVSWDWQRITKRKKGGFLEVAVWYEHDLCALAYGDAKADRLELGYLEGNPNGHPLKGQVMDIALTLLRAQTVALGLSHSRIKDPFGELIESYKDRGWSHLVKDGQTVYLCDQEQP